MRILVATDGSKHSERAVLMTTNFRFPVPCEIKIVSVVETAVPLNLDIYGGGYVPPTIEFEKIARENAQEVLENSRRKVVEAFSGENIVISTEVLSGSPESQIVETAEKMRADLIIVGSHGYNTWERLLLGSVSDSVVHHAPCSVLVVRNERE